MTNPNRVRMVGWICSLAGFALVVRQLTSGGPEWLFTLGFGMMISGTVLRLFGSYRPSNRKVAAPPKPPGNAPLS
jgi:hypothetical protein